jgi:Zn-dependent protease
MTQWLPWPPTWSTLLILPALLVGFTVHELAHALVAYSLGDTSQIERKRLSFNPLRHVSWVGMIAFLLVGFGWAKPVWVDRARFSIKNKAFGMFLVSIAGATANFVVALLVFVAVTFTLSLVWALTGTFPPELLEYLMPGELALDSHGLVVALTYYMIAVNLLLGVFNLIPIPPLDGFQALMSLASMIRTAVRPGPGEDSTPTATEDAAVVQPEQLRPSEIHLTIGVQYHKEGQVDEALARYRQAIAQDESYGLAYYNEGIAFWEKGRPSLAVSAFRAAGDTSRDPGVRALAEIRLRELSRAEQDPLGSLGPAPPPLEPGKPQEEAPAPAPLDPNVARRIWLRLALGGIGILTLAILAWMYVTVTILGAMIH